MDDVEFEYGDYVIITYKDNSKIVYKVLDDNEINEPTVSKHFANVTCKRSIISKWFPMPNELCWFIYNDDKQLGFLDKYTQDDWENLPFRYLNLYDLNYDYAQKVEPFFGDLIKEISKRDNELLESYNTEELED